MIISQCAKLFDVDTRVLNEGLPLPDLIIVDGGKGHMNGVMDVLENELGLDIPVAGLQKNDKHQTSRITLWCKCRSCSIKEK